MKKFVSKFIIFLLLAFNASGLNAAIYKYTFESSNYTDEETPDVPGTLSGFMVIDTSLVGNSASDIALFENGQTGEFDIPSWVTQLSLSFSPEPGSSVPAQTNTLTSALPLTRWRWDPSGTFDPSAEFVGQMSRFSLSNGNDFTASGSMIQQFGWNNGSGISEGEFLLTSPVNPVQVPGPLPLLGLVPFAYYFRKLKKSLKKN